MRLKNRKAVVQPVVSIQSSEPILTIEQVAERLQLKPSTIYELTRRRNSRPLPVLRAGKFLRFRWSEIETWLTRQVGDLILALRQELGGHRKHAAVVRKCLTSRG